MADFDNFEANFNNNTATDEVDPAAEFLAREQDKLAGLDDDTDGFENISAEPVITNGEDQGDPYGDIQMNGNDDMPSAFSAYQNRVPREEPEKIRKWREDQIELLEKKDQDETVKKAELQQNATKELEEWYIRYKEQIEKSKLANRNAEKEWVNERDAEVPGQEWERIARLCDFNPKSARNSRDTSRMRSIILQLKQTPPVKKA